MVLSPVSLSPVFSPSSCGLVDQRPVTQHQLTVCVGICAWTVRTGTTEMNLLQSFLKHSHSRFESVSFIRLLFSGLRGIAKELFAICGQVAPCAGDAEYD